MDEIEFYYKYVIKPLLKEIAELKECKNIFNFFYVQKLLNKYNKKLQECYNHVEKLLEQQEK